MCFRWPFFVKKSLSRNFHKIFPCSCDICGSNFNNMQELLVHMGRHETDDINRKLMRGYGTVRCNKCWKSFETVLDMYDHTCADTIPGLSPVGSSDSLSSIVIHD